MNDAIDHCIELEEKKVSYYEIHRYGIEWLKQVVKVPRPLNSVILDDNLAQNLIDDIRKFQTNKEWYKNKNIPYRRGYLIHGPSGSGKGSLVEAIAGELKMDIYYHIFTGVRINDEELNFAFNNAPTNSLIVLDDLEYLWVPREHWDHRHVVTSSGILNALDGIRA